jgi:hypothetical protein
MTKSIAMRTLLTGTLVALMNLPVLMAQTVNPPPPLSPAAAYLEQEADDAPF